MGKKYWVLTLTTLLLCTVPVLAQISDPEGDADIPCIDITSLDVRGDTHQLTVTLQTSMRPYPPTYRVEGVDLERLRLCPEGRYEFMIDTDRDDYEDVVVETFIDRKGKPHTWGPVGTESHVDTTAGRILWTIPNSSLGVGNEATVVDVIVRSGISPSRVSQPASEHGMIADTAPGGWVQFKLGAESAALFGPEGGRLEVTASDSALRGTYLELPAGALVEEVAIDVTVPEYQPRGFGLLDPMSHAQISPTDVRLDRPAILGLAYPVEELDRTISLGPQYLELFEYHGGSPGSWESVPSDASETAALVRGSISGGGQFAIIGPEAYPICHPRSPGRPPECDEPRALAELPEQRLTVLFVHGLQTILDCREPERKPCPAPTCEDSQADETFGDVDETIFRRGYPVWYFNYNTARDINTTASGPFADTIEKRILDEMTADPKVVSVIAHSMGGLVARSYIAIGPERASKIAGLLTAGTPHLGTDKWDNASDCESTRNMRPCSPFLEAPSGINALAREQRALPALGCSDDASSSYRFYVGRDDSVVAPMSGVGLSCDEYRTRFPAGPANCLDSLKLCSGESPLSLPSHYFLQINGLDHTGRHGIVDISNDEMAVVGSPEKEMMDAILAFVPRRECFGSRTILLTRSGDSVGQYFRELLTENGVAFAELGPEQAAGMDLSRSVIIAAFASEPTEFYPAALNIANAVRNGAWMIAESWGSHLLSHEGIGDSWLQGWGPAVTDTYAFVEPHTASPVFDDIGTWSPPERAQEGARLPGQTRLRVERGGVTLSAVKYRPPAGAMDLSFWELVVTYGWPGQHPDSEYCVGWGGCTPERDVDLDSVTMADLGRGRIFRAVDVAHVPGLFTWGSVQQKIHLNEVNWYLRTH